MRTLLVALTLIAAALFAHVSQIDARAVIGCGTAAIVKADLSYRQKLKAALACFEKARGGADGAAQARRDRLTVASSAPSGVVVAEGDSLTVWGYAGIFAQKNPNLTFHNLAVGGSKTSDVAARFDKALALKPAVLTLLIGTNDCCGPDWQGNLWALTDRARASGIKVAVGTILPKYNPGWSGNADWEKARLSANVAIRRAVGTHIDAVFDLAADPIMGVQATAQNKRWYQDGTHPTEEGHSRLEAIYAPVVASLLANGGAEPFVPTPTKAPNLTGIPPIASGVDVSQYLVPAEAAGVSKPPEEGAFRFLCAPSHNAYDDPIVYPGQPGKSHLHTFFGNTEANASSTYASLRTTGDSTCNNLLNRSAYWISAMLNGRGQVVMPDYLVVYYKRNPASDPECSRMGKACLPLPHGLRYVFGYNMLNPGDTSHGGFWWNCDGPGATSGHFQSIPEAAKGCPTGARIGALVVSPNCWNGKDLDSPDHRSHMANSYYDQNDGKPRCPKTHPYIVPQFTLAAWYAVDDTLKRDGTESWYLSSDRMPGMKPMKPGTTLHSDWFGAWDDSIMDLWTDNCINKRLSCDSGNLGNGHRIRGDKGYTFKAEPRLVPVPALMKDAASRS